MTSHYRIICVAALVTLLALVSQDVSAKRSKSAPETITIHESAREEVSIDDITEASVEPSSIKPTEDTYQMIEDSEPLEEPELKSGCNCKKGGKDEESKPHAQDVLEKQSSNKNKKSSKKYRVITISIPVEPELSGSEETLENYRVDSKESISEIPKEGDEETEEVKTTTPAGTEEEVVEVTKSKKQATLKTKSEKKRSKRATKRKVSDEELENPKGKRSKKNKKGKK